MRKLTENFTLEEMVRSQTAARYHIDNIPNEDQIARLTLLCGLLEKIRAITGPISISSGFRSPKLNERVKGSNTSQHMKGEAADIYVSGMSVEDLYQVIKNSDIQFDQLIQEFDQWVHISVSDAPRRECLRATRSMRKVRYQKDS